MFTRPTKLDPQKLTTAELVKLMASSGHRTSTKQIDADIQAGAPTNDDGTINIVEFAAWLVSEMRSA